MVSSRGTSEVTEMGGTYERMNGLIHGALRRDLDRLGQVAPRDLGVEQRQALSRRVAFVVRLLHDHHTGEEEGIWSIAVRKSAELRALAAEMEAEHDALEAAADELRDAAASYAATGAPDHRDRLVRAVDGMRAACLPHLEHEERVAVPLLVQALDDREWDRAEKRFKKGVSVPYFGWILAWLLDGMNEADAAYVRGQLPRPLAAFLVRVWQPRYEREAAQAWGDLAAVRG